MGIYLAYIFFATKNNVAINFPAYVYSSVLVFLFLQDRVPGVGFLGQRAYVYYNLIGIARLTVKGSANIHFTSSVGELRAIVPNASLRSPPEMSV